MAQIEISDNGYMIFLLPPTSIQVQSDNDEKKKKEILVATWLTMFLFNKIFIKVLQSALYCFVLPCDFPSIRHIVIQKHFTYLFCSFS